MSNSNTTTTEVVTAEPGYQAVLHVYEDDRPEADQLQIIDYTTAPIVAWVVHLDVIGADVYAHSTPVLAGQGNDSFAGAVVYPDGRVSDSKRYYKNLAHFKAKRGVRAQPQQGADE